MDLIELNEEIRHTICDNLDKTSLCSLSLVSKAWTQPAQAALFEKIEVVDTHLLQDGAEYDPEYCRPDLREQLESLRSSVSTSDVLAQYVRTLHFHPLRGYENLPILSDLLRAMINLEKLHFIEDGSRRVNLNVAGQFRLLFEHSSFRSLVIHARSLDRIAYIPSRRLAGIVIIHSLPSLPFAGTAQGPTPSLAHVRLNADSVVIQGFEEQYPNAISTEFWCLSTTLATCLQQPHSLAMIDCLISSEALSKIVKQKGRSLQNLVLAHGYPRYSMRSRRDPIRSFKDLNLDWSKFTPNLTSITTNTMTMSFQSLLSLQSITVLFNSGREDHLRDLVRILPLPSCKTIRFLGAYYGSVNWNPDSASRPARGPRGSISLIQTPAVIRTLETICQTHGVKVLPVDFFSVSHALAEAEAWMKETRSKTERTTEIWKRDIGSAADLGWLVRQHTLADQEVTGVLGLSALLDELTVGQEDVV